MYFWRDDLLLTELKENRTTEKDKVAYLILTGVLYVGIMWLLRCDVSPVTMFEHAEYIGDIFLLIGGTILSYRSYTPTEKFIERFVSLSVPVLVKAVALALILGIGAAFISWEGINLIISLVVQGTFYFRLSRLMKSF